jgi:hypothetical protein
MAGRLRSHLGRLWAPVADSVHFGLHHVGLIKCVYLRRHPRNNDEMFAWAVRHLPCGMLERSSR